MKGHNFQLKKRQEENFSNFIVISLSKKKENTYVYKQDHPLTTVQKEDIFVGLVR